MALQEEKIAQHLEDNKVKITGDKKSIHIQEQIPTLEENNNNNKMQFPIVQLFREVEQV